MQAVITINCSACGKCIGFVKVDDTETDLEIAAKVRVAMDKHREKCRFYRKEAK